MATADQYIGRREAVGIAIEATPGVAASAPQIWLRWRENGLNNKTNVIENDSAMGVVAEVNDSDTTSRWVEGTLGGKITAEAFGFLLTGFFGLPTTGAAVNGVFPHTFRMSQSSIGKTLTIFRWTPLGVQVHAGCVVDGLEVESESNNWVTVSAAIKGRVAVIGSGLTPAFVAEREFNSKHLINKMATDVASLAGTSAIKVSSIKVNMERESTPFSALGTFDDVEFDRGSFKAIAAESVLRYTDTQYEEQFLANTKRALSNVMTNGDHSVSFVLPQARTRELEKNVDLNEIVTQSLNIAGEYSTTAGYQIEVVLKNGRATYAAA